MHFRRAVVDAERAYFAQVARQEDVVGDAECAADLYGSVDDPVDKLKPYVSDLKLNSPVLQGLGHDDIQGAYGPLWGIPVTVVISRDGRICTKHIGFSAKESFEKEVKSLL